MDIYILRHGIADPSAPGKPDADRPLTKEGKQKLRKVLRVARGCGVAPTRILTSPLRRALETAALAAQLLDHQQELIQTDVLAPGHSPQKVWDEIRTHKDAEQLLLIGHEPQLSRVIAYLLGSSSLQVDFKKGALACVEVPSLGAQPRGVLHWMLTARLAGA